MQTSLTFWLLVIVLGVVGYALVIPKICGNCGQSRMVAAATDVHGGIKTALDHYKIDNGSYPQNLQDLIQKSSNTTNWHGPYFDPPQLPIDPWGDKYIYDFPGKHNTNGYDLSSAGPDGKKGTDDDIGNW